MNNLFFSFYFLTSEFFILFCILFFLIFGVIVSTKKTLGFPNTQKTFFYLTLQVIFFALTLLIFQTKFSFIICNNFLFTNNFTFYTKFFLFSFSFGVTILSLDYLNYKRLFFFEYWVLFLLSLVAIAFIIHAFDLLTIYISIEFQSLIFYILTSINRTSEFSTEAGLKYFILGAFASAFLLFGCSVLYAATGLTNLNDYSKLFSGLSLDNSFLFGSLNIGVIFLLIAILFKLNVAPFHFWSPDVYDGAPLSVTSIFAVLPKIALTGILIKLCFLSFFDFRFFVQPFLIFCCLLSSIFGILGAFSQLKWKRFIAFSSIGHASFIILALITNEEYALNCVIFFLLIYSISSLLFFLLIANLNFLKFPNINQSRFILDSKNLSINNPLLSIFLLTTMFSLAGIPPLAGFFSKFFILTAAIKNKFFALSVFIILMNCFSSFYYIRFSKIIYFDFSSKHFVILPMPKFNSLLIAFCFLVLLLLFLDLEFFLSVSKLMVLPFLK